MSAMGAHPSNADTLRRLSTRCKQYETIIAELREQLDAALDQKETA